MRIKKATLADMPIIKHLSKKYNFEQGREWKEAISHKNSEMFLLIQRGTVIGFTGLIHNAWNNTAQILDIFTAPPYRKQGLGLTAINFLVDKAKRKGYRCITAEAPDSHVVLFYKKAGFRKCGYNDRYYSNIGKPIATWMSLDL